MSNEIFKGLSLETIKAEIIQKVPLISSFDSIIFKNDKPLVICDIDDTILYLDHIQGYKSNSSKFPIFYSKNSLLLAGSNYNIDPLVRSILPTDIGGFRRLENRVSSLGGKLIFLTARASNGHKYVIEDFAKIGLDAAKYEVYYTGNTSVKDYDYTIATTTTVLTSIQYINLNNSSTFL